jgi:uncharacterized protein (DUF58 family)
MPAVELRLTSRAHVFEHLLRLPDEAIMISKATPNESWLTQIDSSFLEDLASDNVRRGTGTDLAGITSSATMEDLHRIDWKATARTGKLMAKGYYAEQPPVMLVIDASHTVMAERAGGSMYSRLLTILPTLLASLRAATPTGFILYDEGSVVAEVPAEVGKRVGKRIQSVRPH